MSKTRDDNYAMLTLSAVNGRSSALAKELDAMVAMLRDLANAWKDDHIQSSLVAGFLSDAVTVFGMYIHAATRKSWSNLNHDHDQARSLHRVVRAMHDGECPKCHRVFSSNAMVRYADKAQKVRWGWACPGCDFSITNEEGDAVLSQFGRFMDQNLEVFTKWRAQREAK
jgi:hypothetical protein